MSVPLTDPTCRRAIQARTPDRIPSYTDGSLVHILTAQRSTATADTNTENAIKEENVGVCHNITKIGFDF